MMKLDKHKTLVIFRKFKRGGDVIAMFPCEVGTNDVFTCSSYQHIGQHGAADLLIMRTITEPATPTEYASLKAELRLLGYNLQIIKRVPSNARDIRRKALKGTL